MSSVSHTCGTFSAASSRRPHAFGSGSLRGTNTPTSVAVSSAIPATTTYAERQPSCWPSQVAAGTPATLAIVSPSITEATARPRLAGSTSEAATRDATPK